MNYQQIFNQVSTHLLIQNKKSEDNGKCLYRNSEGLKCAIGCLIDDEDYKPSFEGSIYNPEINNYLINKLNINPCLNVYLTEDFIFLHKLQEIHDKNLTENWKTELKIFAYFYKLTFL